MDRFAFHGYRPRIYAECLNTFIPIYHTTIAVRALQEMFRNVLMATSDSLLLFDAGVGQVSVPG